MPSSLHVTFSVEQRMFVHAALMSGKGGKESMYLDLQMKQGQTLSPQMIQSAKILQMTAEELVKYINELALENPAIDVVAPFQQLWPDFNSEQNYSFYQKQNEYDDDDFKNRWNYNADNGETLQNYLWSQLIMEDFSSLETKIVKFMLECLDGKGYLTETVHDVSVYFKVNESLVQKLLEKLQTLEPAGICACSLEECLKLQLKSRKMLSPVLSQIIDDCLEMVAKNKIPSIKRKLRLSYSEATAYCNIIRSLNPKPGTSFGNREQMRYIVPDVTIVKFRDHFDILLNESPCSGIEINCYYQQLNQRRESEEVKAYLDSKIRQAEWIRHCIAQRTKTIMQVSKKVLEYQEAFFIKGPNYLVPLRMGDVAEAIGVHESTVSRTVSKKYLQCSWGVYPMSFFFPRGVIKHEEGQLHEEAKSLTNGDIRRVIQDIIKEEDKKKPYSDRILGEMILESGISISRRTVAKYREEAGIPDASGRKRYN